MVEHPKQITRDGSYTFFSAEFGEAYHSLKGAKSEAFDKFAQVTHLPQKAHSGHVALLDICYGLGYNTAAALETIWQANPDCQVQCYGLEIDAAVPLAALKLETFQNWSPRVQAVLEAIALSHRMDTPVVQAALTIGDARQTIQRLIARSLQVDAIFLDPFSPRRCPQLWTVDFLQYVAAGLAPRGYLATYSRAAAIRAALIEVGLAISTIPLPPDHGPQEWAQGTLAAWPEAKLPPLSPMELEHLQTRAAIPLRDPTLTDTAPQILERQYNQQQHSSLESTSRWKKRWKSQQSR